MPAPNASPSARARLLARLCAGALVLAVLGLTAVLHWRNPVTLLSLLPSPDMAELHADFDTFWHSADALRRGGDLYQTPAKLTNLNPPLMSVLLVPLAPLGSLLAYRVFVVLTVVMVVGAVLAVARELRLAPGWTVAATVAVLVSSPLHGTLFLGQIYGILLVGLAAGWIAEHRCRPVLAAVLYGITVALKPSLAPLLLLPLVQRRWRPFAAGMAAAALATVAGLLVGGVGSGLEWLRIAFTEPVPDVDANAALPGVAVRFGLPSLVGTAVGGLLLIGTLAWFGVRARRGSVSGPPACVAPTPWTTADEDAAGTAPWAVVAAGLLTSPIAWHNYLLLLWPGLLVAIALAAPGSSRRAAAAVLLAVPAIPVSWGTLWPDQLTTPAGPVANPWAPVGRSLYCVILLAYWLLLLRPPAPAGPSVVPEPGPEPSEPSEPADGPPEPARPEPKPV